MKKLYACPICGHGRGHKDHTARCSKAAQALYKDKPNAYLYAADPNRAARPSFTHYALSKGGIMRRA